MNSTRVLPNSGGSANETRKYKLFWSALAPSRHARVKVAMSVELIYNTIGMLPLCRALEFRYSRVSMTAASVSQLNHFN